MAFFSELPKRITFSAVPEKCDLLPIRRKSRGAGTRITRKRYLSHHGRQVRSCDPTARAQPKSCCSRSAQTERNYDCLNSRSESRSGGGWQYLDIINRLFYV